MRFLLQFLEDAGRRPLSSYKTRRERLHRPDRLVCPLDLSREVFGGNFLLTFVIVSLLVFLGLLEFVLPGAGGWFTSRGQGSRCWRTLSALERPPPPPLRRPGRCSCVGSSSSCCPGNPSGLSRVPSVGLGSCVLLGENLCRSPVASFSQRSVGSS